jgi:hypothetical protein
MNDKQTPDQERVNSTPFLLKTVSPDALPSWQEEFGRVLAKWHIRQKQKDALHSKND